MNNDLNIDVKTLNPFRRFIYTIGALPTSYLMSMTYEEQLIWLCNYLAETVIPTVNNNGLAVEELQAKYVELKSYVDNYFEDLDVQEEINNKLDEMAESGELEEIIQAYLNIITTLVFDTVSDMKQAENLISGLYVKTLGFYEVGDGGASTYHIRAVTNNDDIDEHFIIAVHDQTLVAEFQPIEKDIHSKQVGLKGDNDTDETTLIQKFFDYKNNWEVNKIFDSGIYVISDTIYVKGKDQQDGNDGSGWNNGYATIKFNDASFHHVDATAGDYSFVFYHFWEDCIDGFTMTRNSGQTKTVFIGCTNLMFRNFEVKNIEFNTDPSIVTDTLRFYYDSEMYFENGYVRGQIIYNPYNATTHYVNVIKFDNTKIYSYGYDSSIVLKQNYSKQQIQFENCDISGASLSVYDVEVRQVNPQLTNAVGSCSLICINNYYDSNIPMFKNNAHNNIRYSEFGSRYSGNYTQAESQTMEEYFTTTRIGLSSNYAKNQIPMSSLNLVYNGTMKSHTLEENNTERLFGISSSDITKSYESKSNARYGYVRRLTFTGTNNCYVIAQSNAFQYTSPATFGILFEVVSGGCDMIFSMGYSDTQYFELLKGNIKSGLNFFTGSKNSQIFQQGAWGDLKIQFQNLEADTVIDIYEVGIQEGEVYILNAPCKSD